MGSWCHVIYLAKKLAGHGVTALDKAAKKLYTATGKVENLGDISEVLPVQLVFL